MIEKVFIPSFFLGASAVITFLAAMITLRTVSGNLTVREKLLRNRYFGAVTGGICLAVCAYYLELIFPMRISGFWYYLSLIFTVLSFFQLDHLSSRAFSGLLIMSGYMLVHYTFEYQLTGQSFFAVCGWLIGICGIWGSALPWAWRDLLRKCAVKDAWKRGVFAVLLIAALVLASAQILYLGKTL